MKELPFGFRDKIGYLFGDFGNDFTFVFASSYLMVFYTKVLGLTGAFVGALFLAARVVDAFTDISMGRIVDTVKPSKDGRFRPWIRRMCVPVALASTFMYQTEHRNLLMIFSIYELEKLLRICMKGANKLFCIRLIR